MNTHESYGVQKKECAMDRLTWRRDLDGFTDVGLRDGVTVDEAMCRLADIESILGNEYDLDQLRELLQAEKDGRLVALQNGVTKQNLREEYCKAKHMADEQLPSPDYATGHIAGFGAGVVHVLDKILTREEAEAALKGGEV